MNYEAIDFVKIGRTQEDDNMRVASSFNPQWKSAISLRSIPYDTFELLRSESADRKQAFDMPNAAIV